MTLRTFLKRYYGETPSMGIEPMSPDLESVALPLSHKGFVMLAAPLDCELWLGLIARFTQFLAS